MSINRVLISGNLTRDPEIRTTPAGNNVLQFSVAVNDRRKNPKTDKWEDYPNYIDCTVFGSQTSGRIEYFKDNLSKGVKVTIEGKLRWSQWEAKGGGVRSKVEVIVEEMEFAPKPSQGKPAAYSAPEPYEDTASDDIPF